MAKRTDYLTATIDTGATAYALEHLRMYPLEKVQKVIVAPTQNHAICVSFLFDTQPNFGYRVNVLNAFCVGYSGEGPSGLHDIMIEAGFPEDVANKVFEISRYDETVLEK